MTIQRIVESIARKVFAEMPRFGTSTDDALADPDRWGRCYRAAEHTDDGSTRDETISDARAYWAELARYQINGHRRRHRYSPLDRIDEFMREYFDTLESAD